MKCRRTWLTHSAELSSRRKASQIPHSDRATENCKTVGKIAQGQREQYLAKLIISWLLVARRQIHRSELLEALEPRYNSALSRLPCASKPTELGVQIHAVDLDRICQGLVTVTRDGTVKFRNPSVGKYILSECEPGRRGSAIMEAHELVAKRCLQLFCTREFCIASLTCVKLPPSQDPDQESMPTLMEYAIDNWIFHYRKAEAYSMTLAGALQRLLAANLNDACETLSIPHSQRTIHIASTILRTCARHGFTELTKMSLETACDPNVDACGCCETPLAIALATGHTEVADILLQKGASAERIRVDSRNRVKPIRSVQDCRLLGMIEEGTKREAGEDPGPEDIPLHIVLHYAS